MGPWRPAPDVKQEIIIIPFYKIHLDLISGIVAYNSDKYAAHFFNEAMWLNNIEIMAQKSSLPQIVIKYCNVVKWKYSFKVAIIHTDRETAFGDKFKEYITE